MVASISHFSFLTKSDGCYSIMCHHHCQLGGFIWSGHYQTSSFSACPSCTLGWDGQSHLICAHRAALFQPSFTCLSEMSNCRTQSHLVEDSDFRWADSQVVYVSLHELYRKFRETWILTQAFQLHVHS